MTVNHDAVAALPISSAASQTLVRNLLVKRMPYVLADADDPQQRVETDPTTGAVIIDILYLGRVFHRDDTDTTTAHDGTTCLVTSGGKRYKLASGTDVFAYSVLSRTNSVPGSPATGDAYLVTSGAAGAWSGHVDDIAVYTARGWEFVTYGIGRFVYVEDTDSYWHRDAAGDWILGFGAQSLGAGSVLPSNMHGGGGKVRFYVENQTTNTPPGSPTDAVEYIIGPSPTGAWAGNAGKIARYESSAWVIYTPADGWRVYDKNLGSDYIWNATASAWQSATGKMKPVLHVYTASGTFSKDSRCVQAEVWVIGGGGAASSGVAGGNGGTSSFGSHCSATGGTGATNATTAGAGGTGSSGDDNRTGQSGVAYTSEIPRGGAPAFIFGTRGFGADGVAAGSASGAGGGGSNAIILAADLSASETVTVGAAGTGDANGVAGIVVVKEWVLV